MPRLPTDSVTRIARRPAKLLRRTAWLAAALALGTASARAVAGDETRALREGDAPARAAALRAVLQRSREDLRSDASSLRTALRRSIARDDAPEVRGLAARALLRLDGDGAIPHVLEAMRTEREPAAERLLAEAWVELPTEAARRALGSAALDPEDPRRGALAAEALGSLPDALGAEELFAQLDSVATWPVVAGACLGLRGVAEVRSVAALVPRMRHPDPAVRSAARETLAYLTGGDRGSDPGDWERWWAGAREGFRMPGGRPVPPAPRAAGDPGDAGRTSDAARDAGEPTWAEFFGLPIRGRRVAFVIDFSQSMWGPRRTQAERELLDAVKALPGRAEVSVVLFNERVWWFRDAPFPARPQEKWDLAEYLPAQETKSYTNLHDAVESALGLLGVGPAARDPAPGLDDLIVLSDGMPNRGRLRDPDRICEALTALNAGRARIHCVALAEEGASLLRRLAKENGGGFAAAPVPK